MKILYIHQYFNTPAEGGSTRSYWISKELVEAGHELVLVTSAKGDNKAKSSLIDGIQVTYVPSYKAEKTSFWSRLRAYTSFMFASTKFAMKQKGIDLVIATSTPLTIGFPALVLKKLKNIPYVFEVRDLWPEVPIQMGGLNNPLARKLAIWFEKTIYKNATHIVALSPGMKEGVVKTGIPDESVSMIPNMSKIDKFWPRANKEGLAASNGLKENSFKVIYFGSMGLSNGFDYVIEGLKLLKDEDGIELIFIGFGDMIKVLLESIEKFNLSNVKFLGHFGVDDTSDLVNICDVALVTFSDFPILETNSPNKLFDSLSAGKPVVVNSGGWTKDLVEKYNCGVFVDPKNPSDFAKKIIDLRNTPEKTKEMGTQARLLAENVYDKSILCKQFATIISDLE